jgi:hypothetical protein
VFDVVRESSGRDVSPGRDLAASASDRVVIGFGRGLVHQVPDGMVDQ